MTADSGTPSSTIPSTIASATRRRRAAGSMLLRPSPPMRSMSVSPDEEGRARRRRSRAPARPPARRLEGLERELVGDGRDEDAGAEGQDEPERPVARPGAAGRRPRRSRATRPRTGPRGRPRAPGSRPGAGRSVLLGERLRAGLASSSSERLVWISSASAAGKASRTLVDDGVGGHDEERRGARRDLLPHLLDEALVDADVGERAGERPGRRADGQAEQRDEEDQAEEEAPEGAAERPGPGQVVEVAGLRLLLAVRPASRSAASWTLMSSSDWSRSQRAEGALRALGGVELPDREGRHSSPPVGCVCRPRPPSVSRWSSSGSGTCRSA